MFELFFSKVKNIKNRNIFSTVGDTSIKCPKVHPKGPKSQRQVNEIFPKSETQKPYFLQNLEKWKI